MVDGLSCRANRLAFVLMTGAWPVGLVDHKNGDTLDNRWKNLRDTTYAVNSQNRRRDILRGTDVRGGKFRARIRVGGKLIHLGTFATEDSARSAYVEAKARLHPEWSR